MTNTYCKTKFNIPFFFFFCSVYTHNQFYTLYCHVFGDPCHFTVLQGKGHWDLASCEVSLNSTQRFQRRSRKGLSQSEARVAILFFRSTRKTQNWYRTLRSCFLPSFVESCSEVSEVKSKISQQIRVQGGHLVFPIGRKNTNFVEDVEILLPDKYRLIPFSCFREEV